MNNVRLKEYIDEKVALISERLAVYADMQEVPDTLRNAMAYSLLAGGNGYGLYLYLRHLNRSASQ